MDIFLSVNNREEVVQIPVMPEEFSVSKPQGNSVFETIKYGELHLYGTPKLETISWQSFFPVRDYPFVRKAERIQNDTVWKKFYSPGSIRGHDYVAKIDSWIEQKLPIRLIITDTPINMAVLVDAWDWRIGSDGDYYYTLSLKRFPMPQISTNGSWINR